MLLVNDCLFLTRTTVRTHRIVNGRCTDNRDTILLCVCGKMEWLHGVQGISKNFDWLAAALWRNVVNRGGSHTALWLRLDGFFLVIPIIVRTMVERRWHYNNEQTKTMTTIGEDYWLLEQPSHCQWFTLALAPAATHARQRLGWGSGSEPFIVSNFLKSYKYIIKRAMLARHITRESHWKFTWAYIFARCGSHQQDISTIQGFHV